MKNETYQGIVRHAFELWYIYDEYDDAINEFKKARDLAKSQHEVMFCNTHINLIKINQEADLSNTLNDISNQQEL